MEGKSKKETRQVAPIGLRRVLSDTVTRFLTTPIYEHDGQRDYYQPEDAVHDTLSDLIAQNPGLTNREIFFACEPTTTVTPHRLVEIEAFPNFLQESDNWNSVIDRVNTMPPDESEQLYSALTEKIIEIELDKPDNFSSPGVFQDYLDEKEKRSREE